MIKEPKNITTIQEHSKNLKAILLIGWVIIFIAIFFVDMETDSSTKALMIMGGVFTIVVAKVMMWWKHG